MVDTKKLEFVAENILDVRKKFKMLVHLLEQAKGRVLDTEEGGEWMLRNRNDSATQLADQQRRRNENDRVYDEELIGVAESTLGEGFLRRELIALMHLLELIGVTESTLGEGFLRRELIALMHLLELIGIAKSMRYVFSRETTLYEGFLKMLMWFVLERVNGWILVTERAFEWMLRNQNDSATQLAEQRSQIWKLVSQRLVHETNSVDDSAFNEFMYQFKQLLDTERAVESAFRDSAAWLAYQRNQECSCVFETGVYEFCYAVDDDQCLGANHTDIDQSKTANQTKKLVAEVINQLEKKLADASTNGIKLANGGEINQLLVEKGYQCMCPAAEEIKLLVEKCLASMINSPRVSAILTQVGKRNIDVQFSLALTLDVKDGAFAIELTIKKERNTKESQWKVFTNNIKTQCHSKAEANIPSSPPIKRCLSKQSSCSSNCGSETDGWVADYEEAEENEDHRLKILFRRKRSTVNPYMITFPYRVVGPGPGKRLLYEIPLSGELEIRLQRSGYSPSADTSDTDTENQHTRKTKRFTKKKVKGSKAGSESD